MRAKRRGRPLSRVRVQPPPDADLAQLADRAVYIPSPEHKDHVVPGQPMPKPRTDATRCPVDVTQAEAEAWLRDALRAGQVGGPWVDQPYPQYVWIKTGGRVYEARLTNAEQGWFKGYPLDATEVPAWLS
jgi:hypothetical protein